MAAPRELIAILMEEIANNTEIEHFQANIEVATGVNNVVTAAAQLLSNATAPVRVQSYVEDVVDLYSDMEFKSHFRMQRSTFEALCREVAPSMQRERSMTVNTRLLATIWMLSNKECYRSVADRFGISKGTLHLTVIQTCQTLSNLKDKYIKFPEARREMLSLAEGFRVRCGFPGVVGAIDGTHIPIPAPISEFRASFINRKGLSSMQLQVVCDSNLRFLDTYTGWPGSVHDARVYGNSPVQQLIEELPDEFHVLGDSAYPLSAHLLTPYRDNGHLDRVQKQFNKAHSSTRVDVERAIGLLKAKFRRLKSLDMLKQEKIPEVITACCVLHNFILDNENLEDVLSDPEVEAQVDEGEPEQPAGPVNVRGAEKRREISFML